MHWVAAFLVMLLAMPVAAQERPAVRPVHDVSVTYRLRGVDPNGRPESRQVHMSWTDQGRRMRLEMEGQSDFTLVDYETNRITMVCCSGSCISRCHSIRGIRRAWTFPPASA